MEIEKSVEDAMMKADSKGGILMDAIPGKLPSWKCCKNHRFNLSYKQILSGLWCTECKESIGETAVRQHLELRKIRYEQEKTFPGLSDIGCFRFDFWLPDLNLSVEIDGEWHFKKIKPKKIDGDKRRIKANAPSLRLKKQIEHDIIKDDWCKETKNNMLRIPFWQLPILEELLDKSIKEINSDKSKHYYWCSYVEWRLEALKSLNSKGKIKMPRSPAPRGTQKKTWDNRKERASKITGEIALPNLAAVSIVLKKKSAAL